jgi:hypothetical protein
LLCSLAFRLREQLGALFFPLNPLRFLPSHFLLLAPGLFLRSCCLQFLKHATGAARELWN